MKTHRFVGGHHHSRIRTLAVLALVSGAVTAASPPAWWSAQSVLNSQPGIMADDYAAANLGQLKTIARKAADALNAAFPGHADNEAINLLIAGFQAGSSAGHDDYAVLNAGQVKTVVKKFYDRFGLATPWPAQPGASTDDFAAINVGQLKTLFSFEIADGDLDNDGLPDAWETANGLNPSDPLDALSDFDQDGITALDEHRYGLRPATNDVTIFGRTLSTNYDHAGRLGKVVRGNEETEYSSDQEGNLETVRR